MKTTVFFSPNTFCKWQLNVKKVGKVRKDYIRLINLFRSTKIFFDGVEISRSSSPKNLSGFGFIENY